MYQRYDRSQIVAQFAKGKRPKESFGGQWVVLPQVSLCFAEVGDWRTDSHFVDASNFRWVYNGPPRGRFRWKYVPHAVSAGKRNPNPLLLFVRNQGDSGEYLFLGPLNLAHHIWDESAELELVHALPSRAAEQIQGWVPPGLSDSELERHVDILLGKPTLEQRLDALRGFAEFWHGPFEPKHGYSEAELADVTDLTLPHSLHWWYRLGGKRNGVIDGFNHLVPPTELKVGDDGKLVFLWECQGVYAWMTEPESGDSIVWGCASEEETARDEGMTISEFLIQACVFEGIYSAPYDAHITGLTQAEVSQILAPMRKLPFPSWHWPDYPTSFYVGPGVFAMVTASGDKWGVYLGAKREEAVEYLDATDLDWDWKHW